MNPTTEKDMPDKIRVLVADDHNIVRMGITALLETEPDIEVIGEADDGRAAIDLAITQKPDVVLMDLMMPVMDGATATERILTEQPNVKVLILTTSTSSDEITHALDCGACGAISKNAPFKELMSAVHSVMRGEKALSSDIGHILHNDPPASQLSPRQSEILRFITKGLSNPDIAKILNISLYTVKEQVNLILTKVGAANRAEAVAIALRKHLLKI